MSRLVLLVGSVVLTGALSGCCELCCQDPTPGPTFGPGHLLHHRSDDCAADRQAGSSGASTAAKQKQAPETECAACAARRRRAEQTACAEQQRCSNCSAVQKPVADSGCPCDACRARRLADNGGCQRPQEAAHSCNCASAQPKAVAESGCSCGAARQKQGCACGCGMQQKQPASLPEQSPAAEAPKKAAVDKDDRTMFAADQTQRPAPVVTMPRAEVLPTVRSETVQSLRPVPTPAPAPEPKLPARPEPIVRKLPPISKPAQAAPSSDAVSPYGQIDYFGHEAPTDPTPAAPAESPIKRIGWRSN
jgi:hypothetical protein